LRYELFVASRIIKGGLPGKRLSGPVIKVAVLGIVLGMVVMIISMATGLGFKREIRDKIIGFGSHIQVMSYDFNQSFETFPIEGSDSLAQMFDETPGVKHVQRFVTKPGLLKSSDVIHGIVLKGVDGNFDWRFFNSVLEDGVLPNYGDTLVSNKIIISSDVARMMQLKVGDSVRMYFLQNQIRARKFEVAAIFNSHFPEFDNLFVLADIRHLQQLNGWTGSQISGYEILIDDFDHIDDIASEINYVTSAFIGGDGSMLRTRTVMQLQPQIFGWLDLLDTNIVVILILILAVAGLNMISGLLILILERTNMIGVLKAMGSNNKSVRHIFVYLSVYIIGRGLLWGNIIGVVLCIIQSRFGIVSLDPANYYLDTVPIYLNPMHLLALNAGVIIVNSLMLIAPSYLAARITPVKAIRFN
jgi:lipoprotein-releasing system permease protein